MHRVGVMIRSPKNLLQLLVACTVHTGELLLQVWSAGVPCNVTLRMALEYGCNEVETEA